MACCPFLFLILSVSLANAKEALNICVCVFSVSTSLVFQNRHDSVK